MAADIIQSTTQQFLDIHDITNNYVIMKDGTVSVIITVDAMNFGLLAEEEQDAVMYAYAGLLNSLNYPIQVIINSQTKDVTTYLQLLKDQEEETASETIRNRIRQYREFVGNLIHERNVLDKKFYVVIPADSIELGFSGAKSVLPGQQNKFDINSIERSILLEKAQNILDPRRDHLIAQFARIGLFSRQLSTQEIIQLFYIRYNPKATEGQQIAESSSYTAPLVEASIQGNLMNADAPQSPNPEQAQPAATPEAAPAAPTQPAQPEQTPAGTPGTATIESPTAPATPAEQPVMPQASEAPSQPTAPQEPTPAGMPQQPSPEAQVSTPGADTAPVTSSVEPTADTPVESQSTEQASSPEPTPPSITSGPSTTAETPAPGMTPTPADSESPAAGTATPEASTATDVADPQAVQAELDNAAGQVAPEATPAAATTPMTGSESGPSITAPETPDQTVAGTTDNSAATPEASDSQQPDQKDGNPLQPIPEI